MFCVPIFVFGSTEGVGSRFHVFALSDSFSAISRASGPVFMFCAPELIFGGTDGIRSHFHFLRSRTRFRRCRGRRVPFSCFAGPNTFSKVPTASSLVFMFSTSGHVFGGAKGVGSRFQVLRSRTRFGSTEGVGSTFHVLRSRNHFRLFRGRRVPFPCFALPDKFSTLSRASGTVFMLYTPGHVFGGTEGVGCRFHALRSRTCFQRYRGRQMSFSCFGLPDSFSAVQWASAVVFMFCAHGHVLGCAEGVESSFHVLRSRTHFPLFRGRRVPFPCFALPDTFSAVPWA
jgi:hypothetical protein